MNVYLEKFIKGKMGFSDEPLKALDLGCGDGHDMACLEHEGWDVHGIDLENGVDLNFYYKSQLVGEFDLVYSSYVLPFIVNKENFQKTCHKNLKKNGWLFIQTFSKNDKQFKNKGQSEEEMKKLFRKFKIHNIKEIKYFDNHPEHNHWHNVLQLTAQK